MSKIHDAVAEVRRAPGVKGAAVLTLDGLVAAASLDETLSGEALAGLASYLLMSTNKCLGEGSMGTCARLTLHATHGKAIFVDLGDSTLVVVFDQFSDVDAARKEIDDAAQRIRRASRLA
jgi:predicted regulator of Ras-like GTPase activity (Roadblock/LC7/MglB family)